MARPEQIARLTGKEILQAIIEGCLPHPPISNFPLWLVRSRRRLYAFEVSRRPSCSIRWDRGSGWAMTLIDSATGCASYFTHSGGSWVQTVETKICRDRSPPIPGRRAEAHVVSQTRQIISTEARVTARDGRILAHGTSTMMVVSRVK